jgi:hypothetical protein
MPADLFATYAVFYILGYYAVQSSRRSGLKMESVCSSETWVNVCPTTRRHSLDAMKKRKTVNPFPESTTVVLLVSSYYLSYPYFIS